MSKFGGSGSDIVSKSQRKELVVCFLNCVSISVGKIGVLITLTTRYVS